MPGPTVAIFGVNPSVAGATVNDQTIRKDLGFGRALGWGKIIKGNKFAFVATDIDRLGMAADPIGPGNDAHIEQIMRDADLHIFAWGAMGKLPRRLRTRWRVMMEIANKVGCKPLCFGTARDGHPLHTSRIAYSAPLVPWSAPL